ncbi:tRNA (32-2'-O)-methyltransferase regulator THADA-like isoform X1 [Choristoneura fumiferana]|uniref:tRNA (32-2'-O)-methyltransferase regulator THADA-like isoform X1 n=1 Tax=Choristoneura fumiferana TaxID=7141 RepID=UPI003D153C52
MEDLVKKLLGVNALTSSLIQEVFVIAKKHHVIESTQEPWDIVAQILWLHLQSGIMKLDDQLLCATCFYTVISLTGRQEFYLGEVVKVIQKELEQRKNYVLISSKTTVTVSMMYGIFQSNFLTCPIREHDDCLRILLNLAFDLLVQLAYDYSRNTFTVFKTISSFKKVSKTSLESCIFNLKNQVKLLNLVNHNWENPITGVRDLNKTIFQTLVSLMDENTFETTLKEVNGFYWNKAKYLMLSIMITKSTKNIVDLVIESDWLIGLSSSLHKPGLVSSGTDMYYAILKKLVTEDSWVQIFHHTVHNILQGKCIKAIENFINYWCMATLHKFPQLIKLLIHSCKNDDFSRNMFNTLHVLKQSNRLRVIRRNFHASSDYKYVEAMIILGIENRNVNIRMASFEIVCDFQGQTVLPHEAEYNLVLNYLRNNVNSDCAVLRQGMLSNLKNFLLQIHSAVISNFATGKEFDSESLKKFLKELQELVISNLNVKGNYQRKITSVKICSVIWESSINIPKNKNNDTRLSKKTLLSMLIDNEEWLLSDDTFIRNLISLLHDPSDDVRENIVQLLLNYYSSVFKQPELLNLVIEEALKSIGGKFFYEISCGQSMFKLIANVLLKEKIKQATFQTTEDIFTFASNELVNEHDLKTDILESIENGKQLHSFIAILIVVLEVQDCKSYKMTIPDRDILELLRILEDISTQFAWDENSSSSDFSQINDMVQKIIDNSGITSKEDEDNTKISGMHQIVLNCIWLNVKACCDLASLMIRQCEQETHIERFLLIITRVLESSRHKGAIEAAGAALGQAIQYLTSLPENSDISNIPHALLKSKLKELIMEASKMVSITRRGAGLSIMVHRIVTSDLKKGKPLFHYFMNMILETCSQSEDLPGELQENTDIENEKDLPKAIYIHFLTRIVIDSSIASDVMYYSPQLAKLAFDNLTNSHWQIRNAALQLYGALVPKLIGQKKASGTGDETIATVACDELRTHSPELWKYINDQLRDVNTSDKVLSHSILIPILNMLANSAMRYNFSSDATVKKTSEDILLQSLINLLDSPVLTVRRLVAKSIFNIYSFDDIYNFFMKRDWVSENYFHGILILTAHCYKYYTDAVYSTLFNKLQEKIKNKLSDGKHSYLCRELYEEIFVNANTSITVDNLESTLAELDSNIYEPGIFSWANARIKDCVTNIAWKDVPKLVKIFLSRNEFELFCEILLQKIESGKAFPKDPFCETSKLLLACNQKFNSSAIWRILHEISRYFKINCCIDNDNLLEAVQSNYKSYKLRYMLPFVAKNITCKIDENNLTIVSNIILSLCDPETVDVDMRHIAAQSNNELTTAFSRLPDSIKINTIKSAVILLQDEDEDVRNLITISCSNMRKRATIRHPYIYLKMLLDPTFLKEVLSEPESGIPILRRDLTEMLSKSSGQSGENYNPFANDSKNIYMEVEIVQTFIDCLI